MRKIAFIGAGNMALAIAKGIIDSNTVSAKDIVLYDKFIEQYKKFDPSCITAESIEDVINLSEYIFLSVKPQNIKDVLNDIKKCGNISNKIFISICAGITISSIENILGEVKIARAMPNTPLLIGEGTTGICKNQLLSDEEFEIVMRFFSSSGLSIAVNEEDINNVTALTGSSPAYTYLFIKAAVESIQKLGFDNQNATKMFCNTLIGAAKMVLSSERDIDDLIKMVTSPNGTTERALKSFENDNFCETVYNAMKACKDRAEELSKLN